MNTKEHVLRFNLCNIISAAIADISTEKLVHTETPLHSSPTRTPRSIINYGELVVLG